MIDESSLDGVGWARFSDDRTMRYRLTRKLRPLGTPQNQDEPATINRVVFVMLNPSTADAFKLDPTVRRCVEFARRWDADVLEVVNLFAFRSPSPSDLYERMMRNEPLGDDIENDRAIVETCGSAARVVTAWGNDGSLKRRAEYVRGLLHERHIEIWRLGATRFGHPKHPLARGKHFIPYDRRPEVWDNPLHPCDIEATADRRLHEVGHVRHAGDGK